MVLDIENLYHIISVILTFLFSFYLLVNKSKERSANVYIGLFILSMCLDNTNTLLAKTTFYNDNPEFFLWLSSPSFLFFPLMYFYIRAIAYKGYKLKWRDSIHAILFVLFIVATLFQYHLKPAEVQLRILNTGDGFDKWFLPLTYVLLHLQAIAYLALSIRIVLRFKQIVKENYSNIDKRNYKWILQLTFVFVYFVVTGLILNILRFGVDEAYDGILFYVLAPLNIVFLLWIIYKALSQPYLFNGIDANIKLLGEYLKEKELQKKESERNSASEESRNKDNELKLKLENLMNKQEPFLEPSLTIYDLAKILDLKSIELSVFLNRHLNRNFFDFVNEYRIKKAMQLFKNTDDKKLTVLEVLYEVGFNSKSSFNTAFKKFTGQTPSEFRKTV